MNSVLKPESRIAVIGAGVAGVVAAFVLQQKYEVHLFEADQRIGGHTNTVIIPDGPDQGVAVDTGFIVMNNHTYPNFTRFLNVLGVPVRSSDMSFGFESRTARFCYAGTTLSGLFAQRTNLFSPQFYKFLRELARFCRCGQQLLTKIDSGASSGDGENTSLEEFLRANHLSNDFRDYYMLPMASAIWSAPKQQINNFPAVSLLRFFFNHGLLSLKNRPQWQTVVGGSFQYLQAFQKQIRGTVRLNNPVQKIEYTRPGATVLTVNGDLYSFDACVIATHADQSLKMLGDADLRERELLGAWRYQPNLAVLHTDISFLPKNRRAWASWNFVEDENGAHLISYHMNRLQGLRTVRDYVVTLNPPREISPSHFVAKFQYAHPVYNAEAVQTQRRLHELQGENARFFCGSYFGHGFHEDAVKSALSVGAQLGVSL